MNFRILRLTILSLIFATGVFIPSLRADEWDKKTIVTFSEPVQLPGIVLPAGTYTFKLADSSSDRNIVQIFNADGTQLITTILAIPNERLNPTGNTVLKFDERPADQPEALKAWFYPGDNFGQEFVYPKKKATELAASNKQPVLSVRDDVTDANTLKTAPVEPAQPPATTVSVAEEKAVIDSPVPAPVEELPKTASPLPGIALIGMLALVGAAGLRIISRRSGHCPTVS